MSTAGKIILDHLAYVRYEHEDLAKFKKFAQDFGLTEVQTDQAKGDIYYSGYGSHPISYIASPAPQDGTANFRGPGFAARTREDFDKACKLPGAMVKDASNRPGGGHLVVFPDANGYPCEVVWVQTPKPLTAEAASLSINNETAYNGAIEKHRVGKFKRLRKGPAMIHKLGHFGYMTDNYDATSKWFTDTFNLVAVDILYHPQQPGVQVASFYRIDLGKEYVDHHCLLLTVNDKGTHPHHSSFEVEDFDTQWLGHHWLVEKGYELLWGVGRHVHGSQIFDYWWDTSNYAVEHYADGDMVNCDIKTTHAKAGNAAIWGPGTPDFKAKQERLST